MVLARLARNETAECQVSLRQIGRRISISASKVKDALAKLEREGLILIKPSPSPQEHTPNTYALLAVEKAVRATNSSIGAQYRSHKKQFAPSSVPDTNAIKGRKTEVLKTGNTNQDFELPEELEPRVRQIYKLYPRRVGPRDALRAISEALQRLMEGETGPNLSLNEATLLLETSTREFAVSPSGQRGQYTPYPATWFDRSRYLDDPGEWQQLEGDVTRAMEQAREANVGVFRQT